MWCVETPGDKGTPAGQSVHVSVEPWLWEQLQSKLGPTRGDRNPHQSVLPALPVVLLSTGRDLPANACVSKPLLGDVSAKVCLPYSPIKGSHIFPSRPANGYPIATRRLGYTGAGDNAARRDDRVDGAG